MARILMAGSEAIPFSKTGGLADVLGSLPPALAALGHEVAVLLPRYASTPMQGAVRVVEPMTVWMGGTRYDTVLWRVDRRGVRYYLLEYDPFYGRAGIYGDKDGEYPDNALRFGLLSRAVFEVLRHQFRAQIFHGHDWQTGLVAAHLKGSLALDPTFAALRTLFTIHNLGYQGLCPVTVAPALGLLPAQVNIHGLEYFGDINFLKAGIVYSDGISTVSRRYADEIQTAEHGFGLDGLLRARSNVLTGIVNGVDYTEWDPAHDPFIAAHYTRDDLSGKRACKADLLREFRLPDSDLDRPVFGMVSRLATQKGLDLVAAIADDLLRLDVSLVVVGSGEPEYEQFLLDLARKYPEKAGVFIGYDNRRAHKIEAGSDLFLMPSRYEPCGLNQIYSLRYGTLPVVRATGGLDDTIEEGTGFKFWDYSVTAFLGAIQQALSVYSDRESWTRMMRLAMSKDYSWDASAREYTALYHLLSG